MTVEYLAGIIDGEGTFQLQIRFRGLAGRFQINPRVQFGFKDLPEEAQLVSDIQKFLDAGRIYRTRGLVSELLLPHLKLKRTQCSKLLHIAKLVKSKKVLRYVKGYNTNPISTLLPQTRLFNSTKPTLNHVQV